MGAVGAASRDDAPYGNEAYDSLRKIVHSQPSGYLIRAYVRFAFKRSTSSTSEPVFQERTNQHWRTGLGFIIHVGGDIPRQKY